MTPTTDGNPKGQVRRSWYGNRQLFVPTECSTPSSAREQRHQSNSCPIPQQDTKQFLQKTSRHEPRDLRSGVTRDGCNFAHIHSCLEGEEKRETEGCGYDCSPLYFGAYSVIDFRVIVCGFSTRFFLRYRTNLSYYYQAVVSSDRSHRYGQSYPPFDRRMKPIPLVFIFIAVQRFSSMRMSNRGNGLHI